MVPKDGSNIKDDDDNKPIIPIADEDDDDNGYSNLNAATSETFDEKAQVVATSLGKTPEPPTLPRATAAVVVTPPLVAVTAPVEQPKVEQPTKAKDLESLLASSITEAPAAVWPDPELVEAMDSLLETPAEPEPVKEISDQLNPSGEMVDNTSSNELETTQQEEVVIFPNAANELEKDGWILTAPSPMFTEFYKRKAQVLPYLLNSGKLPFDRWEKELEDASGDVNTSDSLPDMYEKMKFVQGWKNRVREIHIRGISQFFLWKRFMEMLRAKAADIEKTKVALADAPSLTHLWDFECYWGRLEALVTAADKVMRNLDSALDTLNRGVTIALQAHERGIERYDNTRFASQSSFKPQVLADPAKFDSLDTEIVPTKAKQAVGDGWDQIG